MIRGDALGRLKRQYKWLIASGVLLVILSVTIRATFHMYSNSKETALKRAQAEASLGELEARHDKLKSEVELINTSRGMDREIRERFGVKKPGEGVIILIGTEEAIKAEEEEKSVGSSILRAFGF